MKRLLTLGILLLCWGASSATEWNASNGGPTDASYAQVTNAIGQGYVKDGDTVKIPAGSPVTWYSTLNITKCISLIGAGTNSGQTTIINGFGGTMVKWRPHADKPFRLSGIRFELTDAFNQWVVSFKGGPVHMARLDHCMFNKGHKVVSWNGRDSPFGTDVCYGVIDHCSFYNCANAFFVMDMDATDYYDGTADWTRAGSTDPILPGTTNMVVIENCLFEANSDYSSPAGDPTSIYGQGGGRLCFRNNTCRGCGTYIDGHGDDPSQYMSVVLYEVYSNVFNRGTFAATDVDAFGNCRGGNAIYHDNLYIEPTAKYGQIIDLVRFFCNDIHTVSNVFWWNNTWVVSGVTNTTQSDMIYVKESQYNCSASSIHLNQQYWLHAPQPGNNYYPYTQLGPHPLVTPDGGTTNANSAPSNLRISTQSANLSVGSALTLTANWDGGIPDPDVLWWKTNSGSGTFTNIPNQNLRQFTIASAQTNDSGWYEFSATNNVPPYGGTSAPVYISVTVPVNYNPPGFGGSWRNYGIAIAEPGLSVTNVSFIGTNRMLLSLSYSYAAGSGGTGFRNAVYTDGDVFTSLFRTNYSSIDGAVVARFLPNAIPFYLFLSNRVGMVTHTLNSGLDEGAAIIVLLTNVLESYTLSFEQPVGFTGNVSSHSFDVPSTNGELVVDFLVSSANQFTKGSGQTLISQFQLPAPQGTWVQASYKTSSYPTTAMSWTGSADTISHIAFAVKPTPVPIIPNQPLATTNVAGATFQVASPAVGSDDITYQWAKNSESITNTAYTGVQTTNLTLAHASWRDSGYYSVLTTNSFGIIASEPVYVEIAHPPYKAAGVGRMGRSRW